MKTFRQTAYRWSLPGLLVLASLSGCGQSEETGSSSVYIEIAKPKSGWATEIRYETGNAPYPRLVADNVTFELRDPQSYRLDLEAVGIRGVKVSNASYKSTAPADAGLLNVLGKDVHVTDGVLRWGDDAVGPVAARDTVVVDAKGLVIQRK